ncbi:MAG: alpha/beta fold hydrolase [Alphaproteobacteria bacterium]
MSVEILVNGPAEAPLTVVLAHGAGAPMDSAFMTWFAEGLAAGQGYRVARFEFPYMAERRSGGRKRPPDTRPVLLASYREALAELDLPPNRLVIGGKSLGGRIASLLADEVGVRGLVCLGYPFHPAGRPEAPRTDHLRAMATPTLICQGTRDTLGRRETVMGYDLSPAIHLHWIEGGDHSFKPTRASGHSETDTLGQALDAVRSFLRSLVVLQ